MTRAAKTPPLEHAQTQLPRRHIQHQALGIPPAKALAVWQAHPAVANNRFPHHAACLLLPQNVRAGPISRAPLQVTVALCHRPMHGMRICVRQGHARAAPAHARTSVPLPPTQRCAVAQQNGAYAQSRQIQDVRLGAAIHPIGIPFFKMHAVSPPPIRHYTSQAQRGNAPACATHKPYLAAACRTQARLLCLVALPNADSALQQYPVGNGAAHGKARAAKGCLAARLAARYGYVIRCVMGCVIGRAIYLGDAIGGCLYQVLSGVIKRYRAIAHGRPPASSPSATPFTQPWLRLLFLACSTHAPKRRLRPACAHS